MPKELRYRGRVVVIPDYTSVHARPEATPEAHAPVEHVAHDHGPGHEHAPAEHVAHDPGPGHEHAHGGHEPHDHGHGHGAPSGHPEGCQCPDHRDPEKDTAPVHGGHGPAILLNIDGKDVMVHEVGPGKFHTHELPFQAFPTLEAAAMAVINHLDFGVFDGLTKKSE
ncbi:hypothetical protein AB3662_19755 [Sorangium cellulosum]|uniref:hypothetical protein n=1 Tax=Sorangium cellulosum TaxID=56 RepID=UPI003D9A49E2